MVLNPLILLACSPALYLGGAVLALLLSGRPAPARYAAGIFAVLGAATGLALSLPTLMGGPGYAGAFAGPVAGLTVALRLDGLSAWFVLLLSVVALPVALAGLAYARAYDEHGGPRLAAVTNVFLAAMLLVLLADGIYAFLLGWELMALTSYLLVVHEHTATGVRRAGFVYLGMTHLGAAFLLVAFLLLRGAGGGAWDFASLRQAVLDSRLRDLIFVLALVGCGTKAGMIPLHVWLPRAHPVAPSHVSALMSGVMLKVGIYGLLRVAWDLLGGGPAWWGALVLVLGLLSAVLGVLYALMEHDLKRLLAFHSIENVGIVLIGVGTGMLLAALGHPAAAALALGAGLFHALNHALFKALLFLGAGAVQQATGTRDLEELGGLIRRMPQTAVLFLVGSAAISALPPLNGFASEWLTFQSLLALGQLADVRLAVGAALSAGLLGLTGALAAACFVKAFGVAFLGLPRSQHAEHASESGFALRFGMGLLALACVALGLLPGLALVLLAVPTAQLAGAAATVRSFIAFCRRHGWLAEDAAGGLDRRREPADRTRAIPRAELERLWRREDTSVRERVFWRLCYETAGRATEVLGLNVEDLDLANKRARARSKGGDIEFLHFQSASARLLPKLIAGRSRGPLFLAERRPVPARAPAAVDLCPVTGHGRLSYRQAEALFCTTSGGWTLHQLRHSALTHLAEANVALPLLMAKSRHVSLRSLQRYARPGPEAVAALTAAHDPARRRR